MKRIVGLFEYKEGDLIWKVRSGNRTRVGNIAGTIASVGRRYVQVEGKKHLVHRIIWFMHYGNCPEFLDHIDGNPLNNRIENLRPATKAQNAMNRPVRSDSALGVKGVCKKKNKFSASIFINGKSLFLGMFYTIKDAGVAYKNAASKHFGEYAR
jgi:hypothetical protein